MLSSNLNLNIEKTVGYNNKILISNTDMKIYPNKDINKAAVHHKKSSVPPTKFGRTEGAARAAPEMHLVKSTDKPIKDYLAAWHEQTILLIDTVKCFPKSIMMRK